MTTHQLIKGHSVWLVAHFTDGEPCQDIIKLFETHVLPTPWEISFPESWVKAKLEKLGVEITPGNGEDLWT